ncbi:hypothetical protein MPL1032_310024 [Mesorhizobium plurifarium]|uniref:Uncharacterized protein n=1 Tax=Mesorhizobium plurifarium TaxID=69974 RepID=A0A0K2W3Y1_MESPL|nr:hypothetical protein MPL1032_310024 [Mesorhizobium plurifarium]
MGLRLIKAIFVSRNCRPRNSNQIPKGILKHTPGKPSLSKPFASKIWNAETHL